MPLTTPEEPNTTWSIDFVSDVVESGRKFRVMNVLDDADRTVVAQEISMSMPAQRVVRLLDLHSVQRVFVEWLLILTSKVIDCLCQ